MNDKLRNSDRSKRADATIERLGIRDEYPFDHHFIETPMGAMHYVDEGSGDPVLAIHGNPSWSFLYRRFIGELSKSNRVIAPDHIGCTREKSGFPSLRTTISPSRTAPLSSPVKHSNSG